MHDNGIRKTRIIFAWLVVAAIAVAIFLMSAQPAAQSDALSRGLLRKLLLLLTGGTDLAKVNRYNHYIRKAAHFTLYAALGFTLTGALRFQKRVPPAPAAIAAAALYAVFDEFHQFFVPGRGPQLKDVMIDTGGAATGALLMALLLWLFRRARRSFSVG